MAAIRSPTSRGPGAPVLLLCVVAGCSHGSCHGQGGRRPGPLPAPTAKTEPQSALFDLAMIRDPATLDCRFENQREVKGRNEIALSVWNVSYLSWEAIDGQLHPIRIRGYAARPRTARGPLPAVVQAHGLGGSADEASVASTAANLEMFVLAYSGPGSGTDPANTSEGRPSTDGGGYRMFDTLHAPAGVRGSWFWAHTTAAMRALTCLQTRRDVDAARLGMTGFSAGGVASLLAAGADDRVRAAVPVSGTLAWDVATRAPAAWELSLLSRAGLSVAGREWQVLVKQLADPQAGVGGAGARVLMLNGTTDEFFPLTAHLATLRALAGSPGGSELRTGLTANFDHGCYKVNGGESAAAIEQRLVVHAEGGQRAFFRHHLAADPEYPAMPRSAQLGATAAGGQTRFVANVDRPRGYEIDEVRLWWSDDAAYSYRSVPLVGKSPTAYEALAPLTLTDSTIYFVDVQYRTVNLLSPHRFAISSEPVVPPGLVPHIRAYGSCR